MASTFVNLPLDANSNDVDALITLSGVAAQEPDLGTFTGTIIPDDSTIKAALQSLETSIGSLPDPMEYKGQWSAATNTPTLANGGGNNGDVWNVSAAGSVNFGAGAISFEINDKAVYNGATALWEKWDNTDTGVIASSIVDGDVTHAPDGNSVFDALALKQATGNYITALTGDITASGPGSVASTLATVNSNVGSFTNASLTVNAKGLITAASSGTGGAALSGLTAATGSNSIDNLNNAQTWNWTTLSSGNAMSFGTGNSITSGKIMQFTQSANGGSVNNTIMQMDISGNASIVRGLVINNSSGAGGAGAGPRGVTVAMSGTGQDGMGLDVSMNSQIDTARGAKIAVSGTLGTVHCLELTNSKTAASTFGITATMTGTTGGVTAGVFTSASNTGAAISAALSHATGSGTVVSSSHAGTSGYAYYGTASVGTGSRKLMLLENNAAATNNAAAVLDFGANRTTGGQTLVASVAGMITDITNGAYKGALVFYTANNAAPAEVMRFGANGKQTFPTTVTTGGTTGDQTINKISGTVNFAASASTLVVTNSLVDANSIVYAVIQTADATAAIKNIVPTSGSFTINLTATATAETRVGFFVVN